VGSGSAKGYAYSRHPLTPVYPSLDSFRKESVHGYAFRSIARGWYLEYDW